ncbi:hypothetical protein Tco_1319030 [Tanacetum coccineum]
MCGGNFVGRLVEYFGLVTDEGLMGLHVIARELPVIYMDELDYTSEDCEAQGGGARVTASVVGLRGVVDRSIIDQYSFAPWMISCMTQVMDASGRTYQFSTNSLLSGAHGCLYQRALNDRGLV